MKILIAGASGFIGSALVPFLEKNGHTVVKLVRQPLPKKNELSWDPENAEITLSELEGFDAWVNLSGENIASGRWTDAKKQRILESRVQSTRLLAESLKQLKQPPKVWVNGSAVGYYGDTGDAIAREGTIFGKGFLANVVEAWEKAAKSAEGQGTRISFLRTGVVLGTQGGALKTMLIPFKLGLGGVIGSGKQYMSWISIDDLLRVIEFMLEKDLPGPVNAVAPRPVTNYEFTKTLGKVLNRPTVFPLPAFLARLVFGEGADEMLLASTRVEPRRLLDAGFAFQQPELEGALKNLLK